MRTKHTKQVNETIIEHFIFASSVSLRLLKSSIVFFVHGLTGGLINIPDKYNLLDMAYYLLERNDNRILKKTNNE